jgi:hypothetical protein
MININYSTTSKHALNPMLFSILLLIWGILILQGCKKDDGPDPQDNTESELMDRVTGTYLVQGLYDTDLLDEREITIVRKGSSELEISGNGFPTFKIMGLFIGYQNDKDKDEYIIFSETVAPQNGNVTFSFPTKEVLIGVTIKVDATTNKNLSLVGKKK